MKSKTLLFPFDIYSSPIIRHKGLLENLDITHVVSPNGWGFTGKDAACIDGGEDTGMRILNDFNSALAEVDTVLYTESDRRLDFYSAIFPKIEETIKSKKKFICTIKLSANEKEKVDALCGENGIDLDYVYQKQNKIRLPQLDGIYRKLYRIHVPVIFVLGSGERTDKFGIQLLVREKMLQMGYNLSQIAGRKNCEYLGLHPFPEFMYDKGFTESEKIYMFNRLVKKIELLEKPDAIVIGIPGGVMPVNEQYTENFGIFAYEVSQAVTADAAVLTLHYADYNETYFEKMWSLVKYRFGVEIDCFALSNTVFDLMSSREHGYKCYTTVDSRVIESKLKSLKQLPYPVFASKQEDGSEGMVEYLLGKLVSYPSVQTL